MIRKAVIVILIFGLLGCGTLWRLGCRWQGPGYSRYGGSGRVVGVISAEYRYLIDYSVTQDFRVGLGIDRGAFVIVLTEYLNLGPAVSTWEVGHGRLRLWRRIIEEPSICGQPLGVSGYALMNYIGSPTGQLVHGLRLPCWATCVFFAIYPTSSFIRGPLRSWRRRRRGLCLRCAYDLTGNVSGVCPECGKTIQG